MVLPRESPGARDARDARRRPALTVDDVGDPAGRPVVYLHGGGDSRLSRHPDDSLAEALGVRLLAVERSGPVSPGRTLLGLAEDVLARLDALGVERFAVVGWSAGGPHALALAARAAERVRRVGLVASMPVPDGLGTMPLSLRMTVRLARTAPPLAVKALERWGRRSVVSTGAPETDEAYARGRVESFSAGGAWLAQELAYLARPWGFGLADVRSPVTLWWGERDRVTPVSIGRDYLRRLPHADLRIVDGTHQLLFQRWREILADAARP